MYAIIELNGTQYKIFEKSIINIKKVNLNLNDLLILNKILLISDGIKLFIIDNFILKKIFIISRIISKVKYKKINVFKMKRRKHYKKSKNFKQFYTKIIIEKFKLNF